MAGEFELIEVIRQHAGARPELLVGIGDDCSVLSLSPGTELLTSKDLLLENVHFRLDWTDLRSLALKAIAVNVSDIAAMGGTPWCVHLGLGLPVSFSEQQVVEFARGVGAALDTYDLVLAGGDTCRSGAGLVISVTVQGVCPQGQRILRSGGRAGDELWVSGALGDSALALSLLIAEGPLTEELSQRHFRPEARVQLGQRLREMGLARAMIDLSDGLAGDLQHVINASGTGAEVFLGEIPVSASFKFHCGDRRTGWQHALSGGEDYELLFVAAPEHRGEIVSLAESIEVPLTCIGRLTQGSALVFTDEDGTPQPLTGSGYDHFSEGGSQ